MVGIATSSKVGLGQHSPASCSGRAESSASSECSPTKPLGEDGSGGYSGFCGALESLQPRVPTVSPSSLRSPSGKKTVRLNFFSYSAGGEVSQGAKEGRKREISQPAKDHFSAKDLEATSSKMAVEICGFMKKSGEAEVSNGIDSGGYSLNDRFQGDQFELPGMDGRQSSGKFITTQELEGQIGDVEKWGLGLDNSSHQGKNKGLDVVIVNNKGEFLFRLIVRNKGEKTALIKSPWTPLKVGEESNKDSQSRGDELADLSKINFWRQAWERLGIVERGEDAKSENALRC